MIAHEIDKVQLQILGTLHVKTKIKAPRIHFENAFSLFCFYSISLDNILFPLKLFDVFSISVLLRNFCDVMKNLKIFFKKPHLQTTTDDGRWKV